MLSTPTICRYMTYSLVGLIGISGLGCGAKQPPTALDQARAAYTQAAQDPQVTAHAPAALQDAQQTLTRAEQVWEDDRDEQEVAHLAYLAEQQTQIAQAKAEYERLEEERQRLSQEREIILRQARLKEAQDAQREAQQAQQANQAAATKIALLQQQLGALQARETERGTVLTLDSVLFETNKATLKPGAQQNLYPLVTFLQDNPARRVIIEGHTDATGPEAYNMSLSQQRADAVRDFLIQQHIGPSRIIAQGHGEAYPVASNETEAGRQQNRRVEIIFPK